VSEDHGGVVLHPIDVLDAGTGALLDSLIDPNLQLINPVNMPHPVLDVVITGSSGHVYCWRPEVRTAHAQCIRRRRATGSVEAAALDTL
jgi:hypothetical protein